MFNYTSLLEKTILFVSCLIIYLSQSDFGINVAIVLVPVIISGLLSYFDNDKIRLLLSAGFLALCCFIPAVIIFMPLIVYDMFFGKLQYFNFLGIIPLIYFFQSSSNQIFFMVIIMITFSILIRYRLTMQEKLHKKLNELVDDAREMSLKLERQNADLIEKQDNELYLATLNERNRIARDIHDNVGHLLSSAILQSGALMTINKY
jgi:signal transduction histidine kinase